MMNVKPPSVNGSHPANHLPPAKPAPAAGQNGDFSQLLKTAQAEQGTPAPKA